MENIAKTELAWAAGFFDGEGSVGCYQHTRTFRINIQISQHSKNPYVLERFNRITGNIGKFYHADEVLTLKYHTYETCQMVMCLLYPYLSPVKRLQFLEAFQQYHQWRKIFNPRVYKKVTHGTPSMYTYGCRCFECCKSKQLSRRSYR